MFHLPSFFSGDASTKLFYLFVWIFVPHGMYGYEICIYMQSTHFCQLLFIYYGPLTQPTIINP